MLLALFLGGLVLLVWGIGLALKQDTGAVVFFTAGAPLVLLSALAFVVHRRLPPVPDEGP